MNENTHWLQVPAAKRDNLNQFKYHCLEKINIIFLIADHGIAIENESIGINSITAEILQKYSLSSIIRKKLTNKFNAKLEIINLGTETKLNSLDGTINSLLGTSTANLCSAPAMSYEQLNKAINIGRQIAQRIKLSGAQLFIASEINKANSISASAMTCALLNVTPEQLSKSQTSSNQPVKTRLIRKALEQHKTLIKAPLEILRCLGSFEIAVLTGSYLCCAHMGLPILINSYASAVAALVASRLCPTAEQWFLFSHPPVEAGHKIILEELKAKPLIANKKSENYIDDLMATLALLQLNCNKHNEVLNL